jgi:chromosome segregation ATPase
MCELETSVNTIKRRRQLVRDLEKLSNPIDTLQAIGADRRKAEEAFDTAKHRFDETMAALQVRERQYRSSLQMAEGIRRELDNLTPELTGEARTSRREANQLTAKATEIDRQAEEILHGRLVRAKCGLAESHNPEDRKHYETEKLAAERAIADLKVQARELRQRATELSRRAEEIKASCYAE